jgi:hypothetical protein
MVSSSVAYCFSESGIVGGSSTLMVESFGTLSSQPASWQKRNGRMEARVRIELTYKGFADLSLTTWVPRPVSSQ